MKPIRSNNDDLPLGGLLREWKVGASLPPRFQDRVWQRIALAEARPAAAGSLSERFAQLLNFLARPGLAAGYVAILLVMGFTMGWATGQEKSARLDQELSSRYVQVIDPYQRLPH